MGYKEYIRWLIPRVPYFMLKGHYCLSNKLTAEFTEGAEDSGLAVWMFS